MHNYSTRVSGKLGDVVTGSFLRLRPRHNNLALLQQYGSNAWRIHNYLTESTASNIEKALEELNNLTTEVNRDRKNFQVCAVSRIALGSRNTHVVATDADRSPVNLIGDTMDRADIQHSADRNGQRSAGG